MKSLAAVALLFFCPILDAKVLHVGPRPESVCRGFDGKLYVTVMNSPDTPGDGVIKVIDRDEIRVFSTGLDEPKGICFTGEHLVVTDATRVWKVDASGRATVLAAAGAFPYPPVFLNDVDNAPDRTAVFVSDTGDVPAMFSEGALWPTESPQAAAIPVISRVYRVALDGGVSVAIEAEPLMLNANGVAVPERGLLLVAEFFRGKILEHRNGKLDVLAEGLRGADGIVRDAAGRLYVSSWTQGKVWRLEADGSNPQVILEGLKNAADFFLDEDARQLIVPDMETGMLHFHTLK